MDDGEVYATEDQWLYVKVDVEKEAGLYEACDAYLGYGKKIL